MDKTIKKPTQKYTECNKVLCGYSYAKISKIKWEPSNNQIAYKQTMMKIQIVREFEFGFESHSSETKAQWLYRTAANGTPNSNPIPYQKP